jgi:hypothetical protein
VEWTAYEADRYRPAVRRRVYAPSINEALDAMVADRGTDETLERIEDRSIVVRWIFARERIYVSDVGHCRRQRLTLALQANR